MLSLALHLAFQLALTALSCGFASASAALTRYQGGDAHNPVYIAIMDGVLLVFLVLNFVKGWLTPLIILSVHTIFATYDSWKYFWATNVQQSSSAVFPIYAALQLILMVTTIVYTVRLYRAKKAAQHKEQQSAP